MKLSLISITILILFAQTLVFGQTQLLSKHQFSFYINELEKSTENAEISVVVLGDTIKSNYIEGYYYFPVIDTAKQFDMIVRVNGIIFSGQGYPGWMLNKGSAIIFGKLTRLKELISVADYNDMTEKDEGWKWYSKRFFVVNHDFTIDIENRNKVRELQFLIICPNSSGRVVTTQKVIK